MTAGPVMARRLALAAITAGLAATTIGLTLRKGTSPEDGGGPAVRRLVPGQFTPTVPPVPVPSFPFRDGAGQTLTLDAFRGKVVLFNVWATWCQPCIKEMPALNRLQATLGGERFEVVALSVDRSGAEKVRPFYAAHNLNALKLYMDPENAVGRLLVLGGLPTTLLLDREGRETGRLMGAAEWDSPALRGPIDALLARG